MAAAEQPAKPVVELGNFSIVNPKPPGAPVLDGDFSVDDGNAAKGAKLFKAKCAACHTIKEGGAPCGPIRVRRVGVGSGRAARELRTLVTRAPSLLPTADAALCAGPNMQGPNLYGIMGQTAGKVRLADTTHQRVPRTEHRPCAIAASRAEVHEGYEDVRGRMGQRDDVQLANKSQVCD